MTHRHAICLVVDGLRASALGTYGNTAFPTPQFDRLASRAVVVDWHWADSPHLASFYRSSWQGMHALRECIADERASVLDQLKQAEVLQWLVTDDPWLIEQSGQLPFDEALLFDNDAETSAEQIEEATIGRYFSEAVERLHQWREDVADTNSMAWLHCRGMYGPWDAPLELRAEMLDEEDPPPAEFVQPPTALCDIDDPDELLSHRVAYAAQVKVIDACVGAFVQAIEEEFADSETLVMLTGSRGFALGEHGSIGTDCVELFSERLHVPWLLYPCGNTSPLPRLNSLTQPADIGATLLDWFNANDIGIPSDGISCLPALTAGACEQRQLAVSTNDTSERAVLTPAWMLRRSDKTQLYTKPDDRWECNDVAGLCPEITNGLQKELAKFEQCCRENESLPIKARDEGLC